MARAEPQFNFRLSADLKKWLAQTAAENRRSINGELLTLVERARQEAQSRPSTGGQPADGRSVQT